LLPTTTTMSSVSLLAPPIASIMNLAQASSIASSGPVPVQSLVDLKLNLSCSSSTRDVERLGQVTGLCHAANLKLEARHYKSPTFAIELLETLRLLRVPLWLSPGITPQSLKIFKVSGSLTNAVFFISCSLNLAPTLLLRIYGPSSGSLISRPRELHTLHVLSSQYHIGPRVYGTFENGRVEEYFDSVTLTAADLRVKQISQWIGARMAELHSVDIDAVEQTSPLDPRSKGKGWEIGVKKNVKSWLGPARGVLALPFLANAIRKELDLDSFSEDWNRYMKWLSEIERIEGASRTVFAHNDAQYGNLLKLTKLPPGTAEHRQLIVVDFEYASPNPAAFDIANHFHEWTANYHGSVPHVLNPSLYPTHEERRNFYLAYLEHSAPRPSAATQLSESARELELQKLDRQVSLWSPASHAMWAVWGLVQAREDLEAEVEAPEFDYIGYAKCRFEGFRRGLRELGI